MTLFARPMTYMNRSGYAVRCLLELHGIGPGGLLVVYDDVALPLGRLRFRERGGAGGHRGVESIIESLRGEEFARLRLGISPPETPSAEAPSAGVAAAEESDLAAFVLAPFAATEAADAEAMIERAAAAVGVWRDEGITPAMNRFNG